MCMNVLPACTNAYNAHAETFRSQTMLLDPLEMDLYVAMSCLWVLGTEPRSSGRAPTLLTIEASLWPCPCISEKEQAAWSLSA